MKFNPLSLIGSILLFFLFSCTSAKQESTEVNANDNTLQIYQNGQIRDQYKSEQIDRECLVLEDGRTVFKGELEYANTHYKDAEIVDLKGRTLIQSENNGPSDFSQNIDEQITEIPLQERANFALIYTDDQGANTVEQITKDGAVHYQKPGPSPEELAVQKAQEEEDEKIAAANTAAKLAAKTAAAAAAAIVAADTKAAEDAKIAADTKAAEDAKIAADAKDAEEAKLAADAKAAEEAKLAADAKAAEEAMNKANMRNIITINCKSSLPEGSTLEGKKALLHATLFVKKSKEDTAVIVSTRDVDDFTTSSEFTIEYHHKQANKKSIYYVEIEVKELNKDNVLFSATVPVTCTESGKFDQTDIEAILEPTI
ncbi:hypothetical protein PQO03_19710 [Lentisphaera profundi]|uniref:Organic solvent tolerance-like N-terminal domain-containing protein n=1 Tax=Lentisphaera profundi TaxID=1658616 RepID=A0ABY7VZA3_9BACT|nr:hypothetical protein [Lentisphaera profundi]WDE98049.1 hypothetical protein PQO03_19710 [Lentisphaera profundi]